MTAVPPHSLEAEAAVLSAALIDPGGARFDELRSIVPSGEIFYTRANRLIWDALCILVDKGAVVDPVTLLQQLRDQGRDRDVGGSSYIAQILDATPYVSNAVEHALIVRENYRLRQAIALAQTKVSEGYSSVPKDPASVQKWLEDYEAEIAALAHVHEQRMLVPISDVMQETQQLFSAIQSGGAAGISTGFTAVDSQTTGMHDGDFVIIAARPGMGKTSYALSIAARMGANGYAVPIFSLEMPRVQLGMRFVAMDARVDLKALREGKISTSEQHKIGITMGALRDLPIFIDDSAVLSPLEIKARVKRLQREIAAGMHAKTVTKNRIGAVMIDYLQLMRPTRETHSREQDIASIGRELKQISKQLGVPVIALAQLNRDVEKRPNKKPQLSDLRESGALEQETDTVMFIYRPAYYDKGNDPALKGWAEIIVAKQRNGPTGTVKVAFKESCTRFDNLQPGDMGVYNPVKPSWHEAKNDDFDDFDDFDDR